jgi:hypothetical protein
MTLNHQDSKPKDKILNHVHEHIFEIFHEWLNEHDDQLHEVFDQNYNGRDNRFKSINNVDLRNKWLYITSSTNNKHDNV